MFSLQLNGVEGGQRSHLIECIPCTPRSAGWAIPNMFGLVFQQLSKQVFSTFGLNQISLGIAEPLCTKTQVGYLLGELAVFTAKDFENMIQRLVPLLKLLLAFLEFLFYLNHQFVEFPL